MAGIYRKNVLDKLSSPEQLDKMIVVTSPSTWIALVGAAVIIGASIIWGFCGEIPVNLSAEGILVKEDDLILACYIPVSSGKKVQEGMEVMVYPTTADKEEYGHMEAEVISVSSYISSQEEMEEELGNDQLVEMFLDEGPVVEVLCKLRTSDDTESGYYWSSKNGAELTIEEGTLADADIVLEKKAPINYLIPYVKEKLTVEAED